MTETPINERGSPSEALQQRHRINPKKEHAVILLAAETRLRQHCLRALRKNNTLTVPEDPFSAWAAWLLRAPGNFYNQEKRFRQQSLQLNGETQTVTVISVGANLSLKQSRILIGIQRPNGNEFMVIQPGEKPEVWQSAFGSNLPSQWAGKREATLSDINHFGKIIRETFQTTPLKSS